MDFSTLESAALLALVAAPGVVALEIVRFGRPPLRERGFVRSVAIYLVLSAVVWAVALALFDAGERVGELVDLRPGDGAAFVSNAGRLFAGLLTSALLVGTGVKLVLGGVRWGAAGLYESVRSGDSGWQRLVARALVITGAASFAWDALLARARQTDRPQLVHVQLRDGGDVYGVFADRGKADYDAEGRGLLLDAELVESDGRLTQIPGCTGTFVHPDAVASVSFIAYERPDAIGSAGDTE